MKKPIRSNDKQVVDVKPVVLSEGALEQVVGGDTVPRTGKAERIAWPSTYWPT